MRIQYLIWIRYIIRNGEAYLLERMHKICGFRLQNLKFGNFLDLGLVGRLLQDHVELRARDRGLGDGWGRERKSSRIIGSESEGGDGA